MLKRSSSWEENCSAMTLYVTWLDMVYTLELLMLLRFSGEKGRETYD